MIVTVADSLFGSNATDPFALIGLLRLGEEGRHIIQVDPLYEPGASREVNAWLARQSLEIREQAEFALDEGATADTGIGFATEIRVDLVPAADWQRETPIVPLATALQLLQRPLSVLVENRRNDGAFLRRVAPGRWRAALDRAIANDWIQIENGGGLGDMHHRVSEAAASPADRMRMWVLHDSDAREPGKPSDDANRLSQACRDARIAHHMLMRRAMENYLPIPALLGSANHEAGPGKTKRRRTAQAFAAMDATLRHHYNMKSGFRKDRGRDGRGAIPACFAPHHEHPDLQEGFGPDIGGLFHTAHFDEIWFVKDGQTRETSAMLQSLLRRM